MSTCLPCGRSTPTMRATSLPPRYPWRCLCLGFSQITRTTPRRTTILHLLQILRTEDRTFMFPSPRLLPSRQPAGATGSLPLSPLGVGMTSPPAARSLVAVHDAPTGQVVRRQLDQDLV